MQIRDVLCVAGRSGYMLKDLQAIRAGRTDRIFSATRQGWSKGKGGCDASMKLCLSSSRCESCLAKGEPTRVSSKPCADPRDGVCDA